MLGGRQSPEYIAASRRPVLMADAARWLLIIEMGASRSEFQGAHRKE
jgi:hypothetical protein